MTEAHRKTDDPESDFKSVRLPSGRKLRGLKGRTELRRDKRKLEILSTTDHLTGLANRRALEKSLSASIDSFSRRGVPFCVVNIDLADFKVINDDPELGHAEGDRILQLFANLLTSSSTATTLSRPAPSILRPSTNTLSSAKPSSNSTIVVVKQLSKFIETESL